MSSTPNESSASEDLLKQVYGELRYLAAQRIAHEAAGHTLQPTALVHEAWLRLIKDKEHDWQDRSYFFAAAAEAMRRILVENARKRARLKHGGGQPLLNIDEFEVAEPSPEEKLLLVDEALAELEKQHAERARVVMLKYFSGLTNKQVAEALGVSESSVDRLWFGARRWLYKRLRPPT